ncbi:MAG: FHA domain-containing protein [Leptolyngbyaceae cyanobacterium bins.59]|nr:FHA domain-containing protein [Leptolyngbyaceae cyanobacterium bins.59]
MIICPNCNHQNPDGASQCEACYTPLPITVNCPNCGTAVQADAHFCGQCGFNLQATSAIPTQETVAPGPIIAPASLPDLASPDPLVPPDPITSTPPISNIPSESSALLVEGEELISSAQNLDSGPSEPTPSVPIPTPLTPGSIGQTQLQQQTARLLHIRTNTTIELPPTLTLIHIGKPNDRIPPDIDVSGFPDSDIVSRVHADIRVEGDAYYIEDVGSSNGTYINNTPLAVGNRHRLRAGDRIALGKGDRVAFLFQLG